MPKNRRPPVFVPDVTPSEKTIEDFQRVLSPYAGHEISREDAIESFHNLMRYFNLLAQWAWEDGIAPFADVDSPDDGEAAEE